MSMDPWGNEIDNGGGYNGIFAIRKSLDGDNVAEFVDKQRFIGIGVGDEDFLMSIEYINEIMMLPVITFVPNSARYIEGVMNLRGTIIPVINLRKMMGLPQGETNASTRAIICKDNASNLRVAIVVDAIKRVVSLRPDDIDSSSPPLAASGYDLLSGVSRHNSNVSGVLSFDKILGIASDGKIQQSPEDNEDDQHTA